MSCEHAHDENGANSLMESNWFFPFVFRHPIWNDCPSIFARRHTQVAFRIRQFKFGVWNHHTNARSTCILMKGSIPTSNSKSIPLEHIFVKAKCRCCCTIVSAAQLSTALLRETLKKVLKNGKKNTRYRNLWHKKIVIITNPALLATSRLWRL